MCLLRGGGCSDAHAKQEDWPSWLLYLPEEQLRQLLFDCAPSISLYLSAFLQSTLALFLDERPGEVFRMMPATPWNTLLHLHSCVPFQQSKGSSIPSSGQYAPDGPE